MAGSTSIVARSCLLVSLLLLHIVAATAFTAPPQEGRDQPLRMLDARVNLKASHVHATQARVAAAGGGLERAQGNRSAIAAAFAQRSNALGGLDAAFSDVTGGPSSVRSRHGALTAAAPGRSSEDIVRGFLANQGALYGLSAADVDDLVVLGDSPGGASGLRMLRLEQRIDGRPVFQSESRFLLHSDGRLMKSVGLLVPQARAAAPNLTAVRTMPAATALGHLMDSLGKSVDPSTVAEARDNSGQLLLTADDPFVAGPVTAREVLFPLSPGLLVPAWSLVVFTAGREDWYAVVDAETGDLLWRKNIRNYASAHDARFRVYVQADGTTPADSPAPMSPTTAMPGAGTQFPAIAPTIVSMHTAMDPLASPGGWIDDCPAGGCTAAQTQTLGNNVLACLDRTVGTVPTTNVCDTDAASVLDGNGRPTGNPDSNGRNRDFLGTTPRDFQGGFLPPPQGGNPEAGQSATGVGNNGTTAIDSFRRGVVTHLFYLTNWYHDKLYALGFDEASGNFQRTNFTGMGVGNDRVLADVQDGGGTDNANFSTPPDGTSGRMQMYRFTDATSNRDGSLDAEIVLHELTHGTSNRLVGNAAGLNWDPAAGMGEGWSDFYALSLLNNTNADDPNGTYASGAYATYKWGGLLDNYVYGIRRFPYSTSHAVNPLTWADVDDVTNDMAGGIPPSPLDHNYNGGMEVHNIGEIWANTLWGVRSRIIANPAGANGSVPLGNQTTLRLVTDGLKMTPIDPTFTEARDAILDADCATNACANEAFIWAGFADRGLGYGASTPYRAVTAYYAGHMAIRETFSVPYLDVQDVVTDVTINDAAPNNNNGAIDPGEAIRITVKLTNPWRAVGKAVVGAVATLTTATPGITILDNTATYGAIAPLGSATGDSFMFLVGTGVPCGSAIDFTLTTVSSLGTTSTTFQLRVGAANGTNPVVTYTGNPNPDLAIPDVAPRGVMHQIDIADDFVIADLNFRIDSITHTWTGDITAMLRSPRGLGVDLVSLIGYTKNTAGGGSSGDNITNMVIDDDLALATANDMAQVASTAAPYTGSWLPVFNSPWTTTAGLTRDTVGNLTRYNGTSTKGTWTVLVSDQFQLETGTFNQWSMLVTPVKFTCSPIVPAVSMSATMAVSAAVFKVGQPVTYTVTLANNGTALQADNSGHEFTSVLPASLALAGATATRGAVTFTPATNTVTWDGALLPLGGSVTITITADIQGGTQGQTIASQGTVAYDADGNGSNESTLMTDDPGAAGTANPTSFRVNSPPSGSTAFGAANILLNGTTSLTITLTNPAGNVALSGVGIVDTLPAGLVVATPNGAGGTCNGAVTAVAGSASVSLAGATLGVGASCTVIVHIAGTTTGTRTNTPTVSASESGSGTLAGAALGVYSLPTFAKAFGAPVIPLNSATTLSFTIQNPNPAALTGVGFTDLLPPGMIVSVVPNVTGSCGGGVITAAGGSGTISLAGATLGASASCTFSISVSGATAGMLTNTTGVITATETGAGSTASAIVTVVAPPTIQKAFGHPNLAQGDTTTLTFKVANPAANAVPLSGVAFTDNFPAGLAIATPSGLSGSCGGGVIAAVAGSAAVSLSAATLPLGGNCVFSVNVAGSTEGIKNNTTGPVSASASGSGAPSNTATVTVSFATLDLDASGAPTQYDALTDGLLAFRYLSNLTGPALPVAALGGTATRTDPAALKTYLDSIRSALDIDGNGTADPVTDGVLIVRYLFGLRGAALIQGALGANATRTSAAAIEDYLSKLTP